MSVMKETLITPSATVVPVTQAYGITDVQVSQMYAAYDSDARVHGPDDYEAFRDAIASVLGPIEGCASCGQVPRGQGGEYPCKTCGLPTLHDDPSDEGVVPSVIAGVPFFASASVQDKRDMLDRFNR